jgi:hypothetical protein
MLALLYTEHVLNLQYILNDILYIQKQCTVLYIINECWLLVLYMM